MTDQERIARYGINVLSFFDGISAGQEALRQLNVKVANYYAVEIEESAIRITQHHFPNTIQKGDIIAWENKEREFIGSLPDIDLVFAGSPCQGFSKGGNREGLEHELSRLFFNFYKIWTAINKNRKKNRKPPVPFFFENVGSMDKDDVKTITGFFNSGPPLKIDAKHYSPCCRDRYYWTNMRIPNAIYMKNKSSKVYKDVRIPDHGEPSKDRLVYYMDPKGAKDPKNQHNRLHWAVKKSSLSMVTVRMISSHGWRINRFNAKIPCFTKGSQGFDDGLGVIAYPKSVWSKKNQEIIDSYRDKNKQPVIKLDIPRELVQKWSLTDSKAYAVRVSIQEACVSMGFDKDYLNVPGVTYRQKIEAIGNSWSVTVVKMLIEHYCTQVGWTGARKR